jgi:hypothetical protein
MSSPHVAGLAALLKDLHPTWSPMAIKSALMTTAYDVLDGGTPAPNTNPVLIFRQGAGHVAPNSAANPGLVYDSSFNDWLAVHLRHPAGGARTHLRAFGAPGLRRTPATSTPRPSPSVTSPESRP